MLGGLRARASPARAGRRAPCSLEGASYARMARTEAPPAPRREGTPPRGHTRRREPRGNAGCLRSVPGPTPPSGHFLPFAPSSDAARGRLPRAHAVGRPCGDGDMLETGGTLKSRVSSCHLGDAILGLLHFSEHPALSTSVRSRSAWGSRHPRCCRHVEFLELALQRPWELVTQPRFRPPVAREPSFTPNTPLLLRGSKCEEALSLLG